MSMPGGNVKAKSNVLSPSAKSLLMGFSWFYPFFFFCFCPPTTVFLSPVEEYSQLNPWVNPLAYVYPCSGASVWAPLWTRSWRDWLHGRRDERRPPIKPARVVWWVLWVAEVGPRPPSASSPASALHDTPRETTFCSARCEKIWWYRFLHSGRFNNLMKHAILMASESSNRKKLSLGSSFKSEKLIEITQKAAHKLLILLRCHAM